jgi:hypothetical protein
MDPVFGAASLLIALLLVTAVTFAWRSLRFLTDAGSRTYFLLLLIPTTFSALAFAVAFNAATLNLISQSTFSWIAGPNFYVCIGLFLISVMKLRSKPFRWIVGMSSALILLWLIVASMH